jgi:protein arginine kinase activator
MICQKCGLRPATVFFSQTVGNETTQSHLCENCAQEQTKSYNIWNSSVFHPFAALSDLIHHFVPWGEANIQEVPSELGVNQPNDVQIQCPQCGYQLSTFRQNGRLGCTKCYESFQNVLEPLISNIHGNVFHVEEKTQTAEEGPTANSPATGNPQVEVLRKQLKEAIKKEKFEEAARLRDEIKNMEPPHGL